MRNHIAPQLYFAFVIRRSVDGDDHIRSKDDHLVCWVAIVQSLFPKRLIVPKIFAYDDTEFDAVYVKQTAIISWLKPTRVVKNIVFGKKDLVFKTEQFAIADNSRAVK